MENKVEQVRALMEEISQEDPTASIFIAINTKKEELHYIHGGQIDLAVLVAALMCEEEDFAAMIKAAVEAFGRV